ncbi:DNA internalization-related competence protein ComEC/Rec2 [Fredinandcohnia quinoae]|uniref:DNA internalization-related competence protein ComEC/Rec2 n=1 Tax=Fredinandcohnia quinoae TaxID=2918902 RepID=A0AAW5E4K7_9BACI|nr:DNA internalization-related competence protein ComEC/Rec2 [Fredinandcohnia sp. SECRCQ15]MCH1625002.1 DNA internalization-related competence protein ComEC/Rec2 [Fredinandcohnia sp. SECRCQ15]
MNKQINYFQAMYKSFSTYWDYSRGKLIFMAISAILGIIVPYTSFHWGSICLTAFLLCFIIWRHNQVIRLLCLSTFVLFAGLFLFIDHDNHSNLPESTTTLVASIISNPDMNGDKISAILRTTSNEKILLSYIMKTENEKLLLTTSFQLGMECSFSGNLVHPEKSRNPEAFNYQEYLYQQKIHWIFEPKNLSLEACVQPTKKSPQQYLLNVREKGIHSIQTYFSGANAGIIQALIYGERKNISEEVMNAYQSLGIVHLLAISGLHISLMTGMFFFFCIRVGLTRQMAANLLLLLLPLYMIIAGASPSVLRSGTMCLLGVASLKWWGKISLLDVISLTCIGLLAYNPYFLFNIGFQLSFIISFSLILSSGVIFRKYKHFLSSLFAVSFLAQVCSTPILLFHFYEFSILSLPLNMVFVPLYSILILPLSIFTVLVLIVFEPLGVIFANVLSSLLDIVNQIAIHASQIPLSTFTLGKPGLVLMMMYIIVIVYFLYYWEKHSRFFSWPLLGFPVIIVLQLFLPYLNPYGEVTILDVGQGDSIYIELPFRKAIYLIDTGGSIPFEKEKWRIRRTEFSTGEDIILPFLKSKGVRQLDKLIISHGDLDHIGGAKALVENIELDSIMIGKSLNDSTLELELKKIALQRGVQINVVKQGDKWKKDEYSFHILSPKGKEMSENDNSIVLYTQFGGLRWLFTGDMEEISEKALISTFKGLRTDVLKVGHHGSKTSTTDPFLDQLKPQVAIIPVGKNNRFNHPHPDVIEKLKQRGIRIFRTDLHGAVQFRFTKKEGTFHTSIP